MTRFAFHCLTVTTTLGDLRERSKLLFGNRYRLEIGEMIARSSVVTAREIARDLGLADSVVRAELLRLSAAGLLVPSPMPTRERYYERVADPFWDYCAAELMRTDES